MCLIISLALPLDRAKPCFVIAVALFGLITISAIVGMMFYLSAAGFYPEHLVFDQSAWTWNAQGDHHFSWLVLAGVIMLAIYTVPFLLRPIDFLRNFKGYVVGLIAYLLLIPMFTNIFSIYAMANLHDISWGNRPTTGSTGTEAFSAKADVQRETTINYKAYRANFLFLWFCANGAYFVVVLRLAASADQYDVNSGKFNVLDGFSMYLAGIVVFRVIFALLYVVKWQWRYARNPNYQVNEYNLERQFKKLKKDKDCQESSDDREDREHLHAVARARERTIKTKSKRMVRGRKNKVVTKREMLDETKRLLMEEDIVTCAHDSDDDRMDFVDAEAEEVTDKVVRARARKGRPLRADEIDRISHGLIDNLKESVLSSVMNPGQYQQL